MPDVSIIVVSYNTRELTLACLDSVQEQTADLDFELIVVDNASTDGSSEAIAGTFPQARLLAPGENIGFAAANNLAADEARGRYLLLLNPDTVVLDGAVQRLCRFADANPDLGIYGGRTLFANRTLNPTSCRGRMTPWSLLCNALGLNVLFRSSRVFDPESLGSWPRDSVREVDIVTGCFLLITRDFWQRLGGFDRRFFMYGEEADLCLRARKIGARPTICPQATIVHYGGQSERCPADRLVRQLRARQQLITQHWSARWIGLGHTLQATWVLHRRWMWRIAAWLGSRSARERTATYAEVWRRRPEWNQRGGRADYAPPIVTAGARR